MKHKILMIGIIVVIIFGGCSKSSSAVKKNIEVTDTATDNSYKLVWSDEFNGTSINSSNWSFQKEAAGKFNNEWQEYTDSSENAYITDDCMVIEAKYNGKGLSKGNFTSARMITHNKQKFKYGKISARIKVPYGKGIWPAFWMLGSNISENAGGTVAWPKCGEIDVMEKIGGGTNEKKLFGTIHYWKESENKYDYITGDVDLTNNLSDDFHIYEVEWDKNTIAWKVDGKEYHRVDISSSDYDEFREDFYILLNVAVGGNWPGNPDSTTIFPQKMEIDYVRVYQKSN